MKARKHRTIKDSLEVFFGSMKYTLAALIFLALSTPAYAQNAGNYLQGVMGLQGARLPPPGFGYTNLTVVYKSDDVLDKNGDPPAIDLDGKFEIFANVHIGSWGTNKPLLLGARYAALVLVPTTDNAFTLGRLNLELSDADFGLGDIYVEPIGLGWSGKQYEVYTAYGFYAPTGKFEPGADDNLGLGRWAHQFTLGATGYFDQARSWHVSVLGRYEIHHKTEDLDLTVGQNGLFEWGIGRSIFIDGVLIDAGVAGYAQWQSTKDDGRDAPPDPLNALDRVFAAGPEVALTVPEIGVRASARHLREFGARSHLEGHVTTIALSVSF
jgi:hypothetical protein